MGLFFGHNQADNILATITLPSGSASASEFEFVQLSLVTPFIPITIKWGDGSFYEYPSSISNAVHSYANTSEKIIEISASSPIKLINATAENISDINLNNVITNGGAITLLNCDLSTAIVNKILISLDNGASTSGLINLHSQVPSAPPTGAGLTAKSSLISKGLTVNTD